MPLAEWLQDELNLRYDVPRAIAQEWVESDQILPLLDGLDEVRADQRAACVEAINIYRRSHGFLPLVITSRTGDYDALAEPLRLQGAIVVQPLTREQVDAYLTNLGTAGENVRAALREDLSLWEMLDSPLLLNVVTMAYAGQEVTPSPVRGTVAERRDHLFGSYMNTALRRRTAERRYPPEQTVRWLSWLASGMARHSQTVFYLEHLQRNWLPESQRRAASVLERMVLGLVVALVAALVVAPVAALVVAPVAALVVALVVAPVVGLVVGLGVGLVVALIFAPVVAMVESREISCVETVHWSWSELWGSDQSLFRREWLLSSLLSGLLSGLFGGLFGFLFGGLVVGLGVGLGGGLFGGLFGGLSFGEIETRTFPNEGIQRSARNACIVGFLAGSLVALVVGLLAGLVVGLFVGLVVAPVGALFGGLVIGLFVALRFGGEACLKHFVLRLALTRNRSTPWNYVRFLDYAAERILLRKVGGGYAFIHRMLLEYFAERHGGPDV
jgi:hypothetical protein